MKVRLSVPLLVVLAMAASAQQSGKRPPRFEDYPITAIFKGTPAAPVLAKPEERRFRTVIRQGVSKGWGVQDGITRKELSALGPTFAGRYLIVTWGCGSPCLMAAIVDLKTGRILPPPFHHGPGDSYFQVPWAWPKDPPLAYRLDSRLLVANICEAGESDMCGIYYFVMDNDGLRLIHRILE